MRKEIHVTYIIKQIRVLKAIIKQGMHTIQWQQAYEKYKLKTIELDDETEDDRKSAAGLDNNIQRFNLRRAKTNNLSRETSRDHSISILSYQSPLYQARMRSEQEIISLSARERSLDQTESQLTQPPRCKVSLLTDNPSSVVTETSKRQKDIQLQVEQQQTQQQPKSPTPIVVVEQVKEKEVKQPPQQAKVTTPRNMKPAILRNIENLNNNSTSNLNHSDDSQDHKRNMEVAANQLNQNKPRPSLRKLEIQEESKQ